MPVRQGQPICRVEHDHVDESDWEENRQAWSKQECDPSEHDQQRILLIDLEFFARIQLHVTEKRLLARSLRRKLAAAPSLV